MTMTLKAYSAGLILSLVGLTACKTILPNASGSETNAAQQVGLKSATQEPSSSRRADTLVTQIGGAQRTVDASQLTQPQGKAGLTIAQLRKYADRCSPDRPKLPASKGQVDCSELSLRMSKTFKSDDKVLEALVLLDRLGRSDDDNDGIGLNGYRSGVSASAVVASGITDPLLDAPPPELEEFTDFLEQNGLAIEAGAIVARTGANE